MPYVLVETGNAVGSKELLAAPATWIEQRSNGAAYLRWPNVRNFNMLNALLADDRSPPMPAWETHECLIKCSNIQSLAMAGKMIKTLQQHWNASGTHGQKRAIEPEDDEMASPVFKKSPTYSSSGQQQQQQVDTVLENEPNLTTEEQLNKPPELRLIGMLDELGSLIKKRHDEARKILLDGFYRVEKSLRPLVSETARRAQDDSTQRSLPAMDYEFCVNPLTCTEEMADFEERLSNEEYRKQVERWIDCTIGYESNPEYRMRTILDALFDREFLAKFSWTGSGRNKLTFGEYNNIVNLFHHAGTTDTHLATPRYVGQFFKQRLKRITAEVPRKDSSNPVLSNSSVHKKPDSAQKEGVESLGEITIKDSPSDVESSDDRPTFNPIPFNCIVDVDDFEAKLNDVDFVKQVHEWVDENVTYELNPVIRMMQILYMLFDKDFLACFTWIGAKQGSYGMVRYVNIINLFVYVGSTVAHRADVAFVENFFMKKLRDKR